VQKISLIGSHRLRASDRNCGLMPVCRLENGRPAIRTVTIQAQHEGGEKPDHNIEIERGRDEAELKHCQK
jgi:hypothetical protein